MTVYAEVVFAENAIVDYFLLLLTQRVCKVQSKHMVYASLFGAGMGTLAPLYPLLTRLPFSLCVTLITVFLCFEIQKLSELLVSALVLFGAGGTLCGIVTFFLKEASYGFAVCISDPVLITALFSLFFSVLLYRVTCRLLIGRRLKERTVSLLLHDRSITALIDSGNTLYYKNKPVILLNRQYGEKEPDLCIPYRTVNGEGILWGYESHDTEIFYEGQIRHFSCVVGLCDHSFPAGVQALLHPDLIKERVL